MPPGRDSGYDCSSHLRAAITPYRHSDRHMLNWAPCCFPVMCALLLTMKQGRHGVCFVTHDATSTHLMAHDAMIMFMSFSSKLPDVRLAGNVLCVRVAHLPLGRQHRAAPHATQRTSNSPSVSPKRPFRPTKRGFTMLYQNQVDTRVHKDAKNAI